MTAENRQRPGELIASVTVVPPDGATSEQLEAIRKAAAAHGFEADEAGRVTVHGPRSTVDSPGDEGPGGER